MPITKKQFEIFDQNFEVIEIVREISEYRAFLDFDGIIEAEKRKTLEHEFLSIEWQVKDSQPNSSDGYSIIQKYPEKHIKDIYDLEDVIIFINHEMDQYLEKKED